MKIKDFILGVYIPHMTNIEFRSWYKKYSEKNPTEEEYEKWVQKNKDMEDIFIN